MHDTTLSPTVTTEPIELPRPSDNEKADVVSTHVLVEQLKVDQLRELSRRTRIAQSEYLREAVDDLLSKYEKKETT
jgi:Ribbon-helix-helix domain